MEVIIAAVETLEDKLRNLSENFAKAMTGFSPATVVGLDPASAGGRAELGVSAQQRGLAGGLAFAPAGATPAGATRAGVNVHQTINFTVSAIDGRSAARFIKEQGGTIAEVIATAAKDSTAYRRQLQGA